MSVLASSFSSFLNSVYNYPQFLDVQRDILNEFNNNKQNILTEKFTQSIIDYPKYNNGKIIKKMASYNLNRIYNICSDGTDYLIDSMHKPAIKSEKIILDKMPKTRQRFIDDFNLQNVYFNNIDVIYDTNFYTDLKYINKFKIFYELFFIEGIDLRLEDASFIQTFLVKNMLETIYKTSTNILPKTILFFSENDLINNSTIKNDFNLFVNLNIDSINEDVTNIILKNVYQFAKPSERTIDNIKSDIFNNLTKVKDYFRDFVDVSMNDSIFELCQLFSKLNDNVISTKVLPEVFDNYDYFNQDIILSLTNLEDSIIRDFKKNVSVKNIQEYSYLTFIYKFWPFKFLNSIPYMMSVYVQNYLKNESINSISNSDYINYTTQIINSCNYSNLETYLNSNVTSSYVITQIEENRICEMTFYLYFMKKLDKFIESDEFNTYIEILTNDIFNSLEKETHTKFDFNWYKNHKILHVYFKSLFRTAITKNNLFYNNYIYFNSSIKQIISNTTGNSDYNTDINFNENRMSSVSQNLNVYTNRFKQFFESHVTSTLISDLSFDYITYFLLTTNNVQQEGIGSWFITDDSFIVS